jgi:hypothetical protein
MPYGTLKVDNIIFTNGGVDQTITVSGIVASTSGNLTVTGTISGNIIRGGTTVSGATVTGSAGQFGNLTAVSGTFTTISGGTYTLTSGVFASGTAANPSISFVSDPNTGIYSPGADQVAISTNGTRRLNIDSSGNLVLDTGDATIYGVRVGRGNSARADNTAVGKNALNANTTGDYSVAVGSGALQSNQGGLSNVGIGLSALSSNVSGNYNTGVGTEALLANTGSSNTCIGRSAGKALTTGSNNTIIGEIEGTAGLAGTVIIGAGSTERLRIDSSGRLGLGTSSPNVPLQVIGSSTVTDAVIRATNSGGTQSMALMSGGLRMDGGAPIQIYQGGSEVARIDTSGRLGIGSNAPGSLLDLRSSSAPSLHISTSGYTPDYRGYSIDLSTSQQTAGINFTTSSPSAFLDLYAGGSATNTGGWQGQIRFFTGGTDSYGTERARIDSSGRLLVGTSSARGGWYNSSGTSISPLIQTDGTSFNTSCIALAHNENVAGEAARILLGKSRGSTAGSFTVVQNNDDLGAITFQGASGAAFVEGAHIKAFVDGTPGASDMPTRLVFSTTADGASSPTERMRISSTGWIYTYSTGGNALSLASSRAAGTSDYLLIGTSAATAIDTGTTRFIVYTNGNVQNSNNSYAGISDVKLKENIVDAASQWNDLKALQVRKYNFKEETGQQTHTQIGLVAQEVELVSPGLVSESPDRDAEGNDLGTTTKSVNYSVLYMKAVKALQEAMERIEVLEQRLTDAGIA